MKVDFGGGSFASFDDTLAVNVSLKQRLEWCLDDVKQSMESSDCKHWILKSSVTNKGADIVIVKNWGGLLDSLNESPDIREWVLQKYISNPLLLGGHKFHLRVYVLCVGALKVFVFDQILVLIAAHKYDLKDTDNIYGHLTNTARAAEDINFKEELFVKTLEDLPDIFMHERPDLAPTREKATDVTSKIKDDIYSITNELFKAFENEYTVFAPMNNCFEIYGLDFMVDEDLNSSLLEINPGPDFQQTGDKLKDVIIQLWEQTLQVVIDSNLNERNDLVNFEEINSNTKIVHNKNEDDCNIRERVTDNFMCVYSKELSASRLQGGMKFT
eukprot:CAMPEP_0119046506 /NCGR_PEP_ID=MMETSP1177-20130426/47095_1 /TAXON_ID=2985 /ORGANISM="Ochromonas sp, Strain CCMP1899" /LENGTH=327 /DNA_ID=CAMNT_0007019755 /DNA_START=514 /DNA_END=1497 /DNA_ORIENTATION=-